MGRRVFRFRRGRFAVGGPASRAALLWTAALLALALVPPQAAPTLCPLELLGADWCPGLGLGTGLHHALNGRWRVALAAHPLALPVLALLLHRIARGAFFAPGPARPVAATPSEP
jgi:hypothetical protein